MSYDSRLQFPSGVKTYFWKLPSVQMAKTLEEFCPPKAQMQAHSDRTVNLANDHCDSAYVPGSRGNTSYYDSKIMIAN